MNEFDILPPFSLEAEQGVLGGLMLDNECWDLIGDLLEESDFFKQEHRLIFKAIGSLAEKNRPFDVVTVSEAILTPEAAGGLAYLGELAKNTPSVANIEQYAVIVRDRAHLRKLMSVGFTCTRAAAAPKAQAAVVQEEIEQQLFALGEGRAINEFIDVKTAMLAVVDKIDHHFNSGESVTGVKTGLTDLDHLTAGLQPADLIVIGARPSMGKTSFALNLVDSALQDKPEQSVQIYSLEMPAEALLYRLFAILGRVDLGRLMTGRLEDDDWPRLTAAVNRIDGYGERLVIDDTSSLTPTALRAKARRAARRFGKPSLIMLDYLQLMRCPGEENRTNEIAEISRSLKALAKEMHCPVVALSQLNRSLEQRHNKRPVNADLRESGAIEQDADLILFLYRDEVYHPESEHKGIAEAIVGKHRNGPTGTVRTAFIANQTRFENLTAQTWPGGNS